VNEEALARRDAIAATAREMASAGGYKGVTIREVADRSGTTPVTVYRYFGSKDGLLQHLMMEWAAQTVDRLRQAARSRSGSAADRVGRGFADVVIWAADDMRLLEAGIAALFSPSADAGGGVAAYKPLFVELVRSCLADDQWTDDEGAALVIGHVFIACMLDLTAGSRNLDEVVANIQTAATLLWR
jgi:AcrR family transcriptional regulator